MADTCREWLASLLLLGPDNEKFTGFVANMKTCAGERLQVALSPKSAELRRKVVPNANRALVTSQCIQSYETCLKGKLSEVTAVAKKLDKLVDAEHEAQKREDERLARQHELHEQAEAVERARQAARAQEKARNSNPVPAAVAEKIGGLRTHGCRAVSELLELKAIVLEDHQVSDFFFQAQHDDLFTSATVSVMSDSSEEVQDAPLLDLALRFSAAILTQLDRSAQPREGRDHLPRWLTTFLSRLEMRDGDQEASVPAVSKWPNSWSCRTLQASS